MRMMILILILRIKTVRSQCQLLYTKAPKSDISPEESRQNQLLHILFQSQRLEFLHILLFQNQNLSPRLKLKQLLNDELQEQQQKERHRRYQRWR